MVAAAGLLVGRERELATLDGLLAAAERGRGRAVLVLGEPGIGKTTLVEALAAGADRRGVPVAWGRCAEADAPPFWPWRQALRALGAAAPADAGSRAELFARVVDQLAALDRPALLALEDIHWADPASLSLLRFVVDALPGLPLLLAVTSRDDPLEAGPELTSLLRSLPAGVERLALAGLAPEAVAELVAGVLGGPVAGELTARISQRCGGNPFFVREVAQLAANRGAAAAPAVPPGVRQVLERRLTRLSEPCRELLAAAAVAGEPEPDLLAEVLAEPPAAVQQRLGEAVTARLLYAGAGPPRFAHALVRETVYGQQPPAVVAALHRTVAEVLERRDPAAAAARIAGHWRRAGGGAAGRTAAAWALTAARQARDRMGYEQAVQFYDWALESPPADELALRIERGETLVLAGALTAGRDTLREAARQARQAGRPREVARAVLGTGVGGFEMPPPDDEQVGLLAEALDGLRRSEPAAGGRSGAAAGGCSGPAAGGDPGPPPAAADLPLRAAVLARLSVASAGRRPVDDQVAMAEESIALARSAGDPATEVAALAAWCDVRSGPDHIDARLARADQLRTAADRSRDPASRLLARRLRLVALAERGDFTEVDAEVAAYARTSDRLRLPLYAWPVPIWRGARALMSGDLAEVRRQLAAAERLATEADSLNAAMLVLVLRLFLLEASGEHHAMGELTDRLREVTSPDHPHAATVSGFYAVAGRLDDAHRLLHHRITAGLDRIPHDAEYLSGLWLLSTAAIELADTDAAAQLYEAMRPYAHRWMVDGICAACPGLIAQQLGRLAICLGRPRDEAARWLEQARVAHQAAGASRLVAQSAELLAELPDPRRPGSARRSGARPAPAAPPEGEFRRSGRTWQVQWDGTAGTVPDSKGMRDLAVLLAAPDRGVPVLDLVEAAGGPPAAAAPGHAGERLDRAARTAYRQRLSDLEGELAEAETNADAGRVEALRREQEFLTAELAGAHGLGGRVRTEGDPVERARKAVTMRIRTALKAIAEVSPGLARHLDRSVTTGRFCAYRPERPVNWRL